MVLIAYLLLITQIILVIAEPIDEGANVGIIKEQNGKQIVFNPGKFPFMVRLEFRRYNLDKDAKTLKADINNCGGTLIRRDIVLTAAHCVRIEKPKKPNVLAWLGILDTVLDQGKGQEIPVRGYTVHKGYVPSRPESNIQSRDDIALMWLVTPARLDGKYIKLASLPAQDFTVEGKRGWIIGWGRKSSGQSTTMLQKATVRGVSVSQCQKYYKRIKLPSNIICILSDDNKKTSTSGDSGGPFVVQNIVVGVGSFSAIDQDKKNEETGLHGFDATKPAGYTYVPKFIKWIEENIERGPEVILRKTSPTSTVRPPSPTRVSPKRPQHKSKL